MVKSRSIPVHEDSGNERIFTLDASGFEFAEYPILGPKSGPIPSSRSRTFLERVD